MAWTILSLQRSWLRCQAWARVLRCLNVWVSVDAENIDQLGLYQKQFAVAGVCFLGGTIILRVSLVSDSCHRVCSFIHLVLGNKCPENSWLSDSFK